MLLSLTVPRSDFSEWLTEQIVARGWTQSELARRAGVTPPTVSRVVSGENRPGHDFVQGVARALGLPPEEVAVRAGLLPDYGEVLPELKALSPRLARLPADDRAAVLEMFERTVTAFEYAHARRR